MSIPISTILTLLIVLVIAIGFPLSIILFIIGIIRGLLKKGWKLLIISIVVFIGVIIFFSISRIFYGAVLGPANYKNLQQMGLSPNGSTLTTSVCYPGNDNNTQQLNQMADNLRKQNIEKLDIALKKYYIQYNKAPSFLEDLIKNKIIDSIPLDPVTKETPAYMKDPDTNPSTTRGCTAIFELCSGKSVFAYCK